MRTYRSLFALFGPFTLCLGGAVVACGGDGGGGGQAAPDGGSGDTGAAAADAGADASSLHGEDAGDAAPEASPSAEDGGPDAADGGPDAVDGAPDASPAATLLVPGDANVFGITPEDMVVYFDAKGGLGAVSVAGGSPETITSDVVAAGGGMVGSVVWWNTLAVAGGDAGCGGALSLHTWSAARGATTLASPAYGYVANVSPDGSKIAYLAPVGDCSTSVGVTVANTDGTGAPISLPKTWPNSLVTVGFETAFLTFGSNGALLVSESSSGTTADVFVGPSYATHTVSLGSLATNATMDPSGAWIWATGIGTGGQLVRTSDGAILLTDASATQGVFDSSGTYLFTTDEDGKTNRVTLSNLATSITVAPSGSGRPIAFAPNGGALAYLAGVSDAGLPSGPIEVASVDAGGIVSGPVTLAATSPADSAFFIDDGRWVAWANLEVSGGLDSEPTGGGPVQPLLPQIVQSVTAVRSSLVVAVTGATNAMSLVDVTGSTAPRLLSAATSGQVAVSPSGGFVAFTNASPSGLYVAGTF